MKKYDKRQVGTTWEIFDTETSEIVVVDGRKLSVLDEHRAEETIQLLHAGELTPDNGDDAG